jgi:hypothetical protein
MISSPHSSQQWACDDDVALGALHDGEQFLVLGLGLFIQVAP